MRVTSVKGKEGKLDEQRDREPEHNDGVWLSHGAIHIFIHYTCRGEANIPCRRFQCGEISMSK